MWDRKILKNIESNTAALTRIASALEKQNQLLEKLLKQNEPPPPVVVENPNSTPAPKYDKYNRDRMFIKPGEQTEYADEETESCIKECAEVY